MLVWAVAADARVDQKPARHKMQDAAAGHIKLSFPLAEKSSTDTCQTRCGGASRPRPPSSQ